MIKSLIHETTFTFKTNFYEVKAFSHFLLFKFKEFQLLYDLETQYYEKFKNDYPMIRSLDNKKTITYTCPFIAVKDEEFTSTVKDAKSTSYFIINENGVNVSLFYDDEPFLFNFQGYLNYLSKNKDKKLARIKISNDIIDILEDISNFYILSIDSLTVFSKKTKQIINTTILDKFQYASYSKLSDYNNTYFLFSTGTSVFKVSKEDYQLTPLFKLNDTKIKHLSLVNEHNICFTTTSHHLCFWNTQNRKITKFTIEDYSFYEMYIYNEVIYLFDVNSFAAFTIGELEPLDKN